MSIGTAVAAAAAHAAANPLEIAVADYLHELCVVHRAAANSVAAARQDLSRFLEFAHDRHLSAPPDFDVHAIRGYVVHRRRAGLSGRSVQRELSTVRRFFKALCVRGVVAVNPALDVRAPKSGRHLPSAFEKDAINAALDATSVAESGEGGRDLAIAELLYSSGLRLAELHGLTLGAFNANLSEVRVRGKGNKERILPVGSKAQAALQDLLAQHPCRGNSQAPLLLGRDGAPLSRSGIALALKRWARHAQLAGRVYPHRFRHTFASHLLEESADLRAVQELLGHANITTTQVYTHINFHQISKIYDDNHPRSRGGSKKDVAVQHKKSAKIAD